MVGRDASNGARTLLAHTMCLYCLSGLFCMATPLRCRFNIAAKYIHDITVASGSSLNVFHTGRGVDLNLDHHRAGSFANLFTNINLGYGLRPFASGGRKDRGAHSGAQWPLQRCATAAPLCWFLSAAAAAVDCGLYKRHSPVPRPPPWHANLQGGHRRFGT
jgi:hypothetical protein